MLNKIKCIIGDDGGRLFSLFFLFFISSIVDLAGIGIVFPYIKIIENPEGTLSFIRENTGLALDYSSFGIILFFSFSLLGVFSIRNIVNLFVQYKIQDYSYKLQSDLKKKLFKTYLNSRYEYFSYKTTAYITNVINNEVPRFTNGAVVNILNLLSETIFFIAIVVATSILSYSYLLIYALIGLIGYNIYKIVKNKCYSYGVITGATSEDIYRIVISGVHLYKINALYKTTDKLAEQLTKPLNEYSRSSVNNEIIRIAPRLLIEIILVIFLISFVIYKSSGGELNDVIPLLGLFGAASIRIMPTFNKVINSFSSLKHTQPVIDKLYDDLYEVESNIELYDKLDLHEENEISEMNICFNNMSFSYRGEDSNTLSNINLVIKDKDILGIVGQSGSGKSTLINLLMGLLLPTSGQIIVVNNKNETFTIKQIQHKIGLVPQDIYLFEDTIKNNIIFYDDNYDHEWLDTVIKSSQLEELVNKLERGVNTCLHENGSNFSGGQKQRIAIARALYRRPEILILDEATSALDMETEEKLNETISNLKNHMTIVIVAHRHSILKNCNRIIELDDGKVLRENCHPELNKDE